MTPVPGSPGAVSASSEAKHFKADLVCGLFCC